MDICLALILHYQSRARRQTKRSANVFGMGCEDPRTDHHYLHIYMRCGDRHLRARCLATGGGWEARFGWFTCGSSRVRCGFPIIYQAPQKLSQVNSHLRCRFGGRRPPRRSKCRQQPQTTQIFMFGLINIISYGRVGGPADCESFLRPTPLTLAAGA